MVGAEWKWWEVLRLKVPAEQRGCWLAGRSAELDPWLRRQTGSGAGKLFWDAKRQEGVLLIGWARRANWQAVTAEKCGGGAEPL